MALSVDCCILFHVCRNEVSFVGSSSSFVDGRVKSQGNEAPLILVDEGVQVAKLSAWDEVVGGSSSRETLFIVLLGWVGLWSVIERSEEDE